MKERVLIVADLGSLKAYKIDVTPLGTPRLELLEDIIIREANHRIVDKLTDFAGRRASPTTRNWAYPTEDESHLMREIKRRAIKQIANCIKQICEGNGFSFIWLAAHKEINHMIINELPGNLRKKIEVNVQRDFVKTSKEKLLKFFAPLIRTKYAEEKQPVKVKKQQPSVLATA